MPGAWLVVACCGCQPDALIPHDVPRAAGVRPDAPGNTELFNFDPGDTVVTFDSDGGHYKVHYTTAGTHAVPSADNNGNGTSDFVDQVAHTHEQVHALFHDAWGFRPAVSDENVSTGNGGDARFDVYLVDFGLSADGNFSCEQLQADPAQCAGYMIQENDFAGYGYPSTLYANRVLCSHEYFHAVQAAYNKDMGSIMAEGTAVWATEKFDPSLEDFEHLASGFMQNPDRSLDRPLPGPVDPFSYGSAVLFQFLDERHGNDIIRKLWEDSVRGARGVAEPTFLPTLDALLVREYATSLSADLPEFAQWNLFTGAHADPARGYARGEGLPPVKVNGRDAPVQEIAMRVFYASTQYYDFLPAGRTVVTAQLVPPVTDATQVDGLVLLVTTRSATEVGPIIRAEGGTRAADVTVPQGTQDVVVAVVNTALSGNSRRASLCAGSPDEVDACVAAQGGAPDAGVVDAGSGGSGGDAPGTPGCACAEPLGTVPGGVVAVVFAAMVRRARRRRTS